MSTFPPQQFGLFINATFLNVYFIPTLTFIWHTGIPGLWAQVLDAGHWTLDPRFWTLDSGPWIPDSGRWALNAERWTLEAGL